MPEVVGIVDEAHDPIELTVGPARERQLNSRFAAQADCRSAAYTALACCRQALVALHKQLAMLASQFRAHPLELCADRVVMLEALRAARRVFLYPRKAQRDPGRIPESNSP
jgi:hypothetical protein